MNINKENSMKQFETKKYYRAREVSVFFGIALSTVWKYAKEGKLHPLKIGNGVTVFEVTELERLFGK